MYKRLVFYKAANNHYIIIKTVLVICFKSCLLNCYIIVIESVVEFWQQFFPAKTVQRLTIKQERVLNFNELSRESYIGSLSYLV